MKIVEVSSDRVLFSNGKVLTYQHWNARGAVCCEEGYADFLALKSFKHLGRDENKSVYDVDIRQIEVEGGMIKFIYNFKGYWSNFSIPCYNQRTAECAGELRILLIYQNGVREAEWVFEGRV